MSTRNLDALLNPGSVVVDLMAENGGNCPLSEAGKVVQKHGVTLVGHTNYPALMPGDASSFYAKNIANLLGLMIKPAADGKPLEFLIDLADDIIEGSLAVHAGEVRAGKPKAQPQTQPQSQAQTPATSPAAH